MAKLKSDGFNVVPIMSETAFTTDTRFGSAKDFADEITEITGNDIISTLPKAEPIAPKAARLTYYRADYGKHSRENGERHN